MGAVPKGGSVGYAALLALLLLVATVTPALAGGAAVDDGGENATVSEPATLTAVLDSVVDGDTTTTTTATPTATATPTDSALGGVNETVDTVEDAENTTEHTTDGATDSVEAAVKNGTDPAGNASAEGGDTARNASEHARETGADAAGNPHDAANEAARNASDVTNRTADAANEAATEAGHAGRNARERAENAAERAREAAARVQSVGHPGNRSGDAGPPQQANATVRNATAGAPVSVNVSAADTGNVGVSTLNVTVKKNASFALNVTAADRKPGDAPSYTRRDGGVGLGSIRVNHSVADENISNVTFTFSLSAERVAAANATPEEVALYRYHDGRWNALNTTFLRERNGSYVFRAESPGLSDFTAAAQKPEFELTKALVDPRAVAVGEPVDIRVRIHNVGDADGSYTARLLFDDEVVETTQVTIAANGTRQVSFTRVPDRAGTYEVTINNASAGTLSVGATTATTSTTGTDLAADSTTPMATATVTQPETGLPTKRSGPGFGVVASLTALLGAAAVFSARRSP